MPSLRIYSEGQHLALPVVQKRAGSDFFLNVPSLEADAATSVPQRMTTSRPIYPRTLPPSSAKVASSASPRQPLLSHTAASWNPDDGQSICDGTMRIRRTP